jgi:hypothetical protein
MKRSGLLLLPLAFLLLSGAADAQSKRNKYPPIKDENGKEVEVPEFDEKAMECVMKCQEPTAKCMSGCGEEELKCQGKCATAMEKCTRKCNAKPKK